MVKQSTENQYDDDLTLSNDEYNESYYTDADDLFEFTTDDESPISRLKSLVLSIDWEITDEVLLQFNEELLDLRGIWAEETVNLIYVQALEKISKYIYQNKADSHPNAIKLLLTFYYNLEKIVSSQDLSEEQKKEILFEDVKKFENLKRQIKVKSSSEVSRELKRPQVAKIKNEASGEDELLNLKAIVLGIDWEITDQDLNDLRREVFRLEEKFSESRPKLILLQGIGTLAAYIKLKKSNAHPDAFKVMQLFCNSLEKIAEKTMSLEEEKAILFPAVEQFNSFKALLGATISSDAIVKKDDDEELEEYGASNTANEISPALADVSEEEQIGFQAERELLALGLKDSGGVASHIEDFFGEKESSQLVAEEIAEKQEILEEIPEDIFFTEDAAIVSVERNLALKGVDVDGDDDEEELNYAKDVTAKDSFSSLGFEAETAHADDETVGLVAAPDSLEEAVAMPNELIFKEDAIVGTVEELFPIDGRELPEFQEKNIDINRAKALQGVDVETDADDDADELSLPMEGEELAPALAAMDEESLFSATILDRAPTSSSVTEEIVGTIDGLFFDHDATPADPSSGKLLNADPVIDANKEEANDKELIGFEDWLKEDSKEEEPLFAAVDLDSRLVADMQPPLAEKEEFELVQVVDDSEIKPATIELTDDQGEEDTLSPFFTDSDLEQSSKYGSEADALFDGLETDLTDEKEEETPLEISGNVEAFYDAEKDREEDDNEQPSAVSLENREEETAEIAVSALFTDTHLDEDEVVFELFKEDIEQSVAVDQEVGAERELPDTGMLIGAEEDHTSLGLTEFTEQGIVKEWAVGNIVTEEQKNLEPFSDLLTCIHSLKIELSEPIIMGLLQGINALRQQWTNKPLEKTFLQLLSTITQHIDSYRYESSAEAFGLLVSICQAMSHLKDDDPHGNQEMLLCETLKVLEWQQGMLSRQAVRKGDQLTFVDPVRTEKEGDSQSDAQRDFDDLLERYEESTPDDILYSIDSIDERTGRTAIDPGFKEEIAFKKETPEDEDREQMWMAFADDLKNEIAALRQTLQMEIAELRRELKKE